MQPGIGTVGDVDVAAIVNLGIVALNDGVAQRCWPPIIPQRGCVALVIDGMK